MLDDVSRLEEIPLGWAERTPEQTALICGKASLSYGELDQAATALGAKLRQAGVGRGDRVGLYAAKGIPAIVGLYAALKCGAAYVPLDPTGPLSRSIAIAAGCGLKALLLGLPQYRKLAASPEALAPLAGLRAWVLVDKDLPPDTPDPAPVPGLARVEQVCLPHLLRRPPTLPPEHGGTAEDTAYILYTSGSTGTPKGVAISHRSALFFARWAARQAGLRAEDRCSNHAPLFFDLSTFDHFACQLRGGTTVIIPPAYSAFPRSLAGYIEQQRITVWYSVPATLIDLMAGDDLARRDLSALRAVIYAGEAFPVGALRALMALLPGRAVHNWYGPTETNVCTAYRLPGPPPEGAHEVPIGQVCEGLRGYLLDAEGAVVSGEGEGELAIGGPALMQGYFGMEAETARVKVQRADLGEVYLTGDLVRRDAEGLLWFVGRKDAMVKVSGYRVELGEVEAALATLPGLAESCVVAVPDGEGTRRLVGVVAAAAGAEPTAEGVLAALRQRLPKYMIPTQIVLRPALPRTPTGKVDRPGLVRELSAEA